MKAIRVLAAFAFICAGAPALAAGQDEDWSTFSHALTLVQQFVRIAASDDPSASVKAIDDLLAGRNSEANRAAAGLLEGMTAGMPSEQRDQMASISRDLDETQFRDAVKRGDKLAVDLFVAGDGIDPAVIARNLPAVR